MKQATINQNNRACAESYALFLSGELKKARKACYGVHFGYLQLWLAECSTCKKSESFVTTMVLKGIDFTPTD